MKRLILEEKRLKNLMKTFNNSEIYNSLAQAAKELEIIENQKCEQLIEICLFSGNKDLADSIRKKGLPIKILIGGFDYVDIVPIFSRFSEVVKLPYVDKPTILFSWVPVTKLP